MAYFQLSDSDPFAFDQISHNKFHDRIGPWFESSHKENQGLQESKKKGQSKKKTDEIVNRLIARRTFRSTLGFKQEKEDNFNHYCTIQPIKGVKMRDYSEDEPARMMCHPQCEGECGRKKWGILNTTMYVYQSKNQDIKVNPHTPELKRAQTLSHHKLKEKLEVKGRESEKSEGKGSDNLQKILKMKEKIRLKNFMNMRKMKEKRVSIDVNGNNLGDKGWSSSTLTNKTGHQKGNKHLLYDKAHDQKIPIKYRREFHHFAKQFTCERFLKPTDYPIIHH